MKKIDIQKHNYLLFGLLSVIILAGGYFFGSNSIGVRDAAPVVSAAAPVLTAPVADPHVRGWAWSSNIGWISFDCRDVGACGINYKTALNMTTGAVAAGNEHWAWSSNIGWIDTNPAGGYPEAPNHGLQFNTNDGTVTGWMRAVANGDGWDGWIKVTDAKVATGGYVKNSAGTDGGWMWGADVVGWVKTWTGGTAGMTLPVADCAVAIDPATPITPPQIVSLIWTCNDLTQANSCSIDKGVGTNMPISGNRTVRPTEDTTYTLTCQGFGGPVVKPVNAVVNSGTVRIHETRP
jgi:hypothetical protein